jgi:hypothetical protein
LSTVTQGWSPPVPPLVLVGLYALALVVGGSWLVYQPARARHPDETQPLQMGSLDNDYRIGPEKA